MAERALQICSEPGCGVVVRADKCVDHADAWKKERQKQYVRKDQGSYTYKWAKASKRYRTLNPLCVPCLLMDRTMAASCVDHIVPHQGRQDLFWDKGNWCSMCWVCHSIKTRSEDRLPAWEPQHRRVVLCGLPATGKTTLANERAKAWGCDVWDWDEAAADAGLSMTKTWSKLDWRYLLGQRRQWIVRHKGSEPAIAIVSRPIMAMQLACQMTGKVTHVACQESERQRRIADRNKGVDQWRAANV